MLNDSTILSDIENVINNQNLHNDKYQELANIFLDELELGKIRCAYKKDDTWYVDSRVKKAILFCFQHGVNKQISNELFSYIDKDILFPQKIALDKNSRVVPGGVSVRRGAYIGNSVTLMPPSYVNIAAFIDDNSMIDSNALVGSCAQIGKNVHISAGAQIGGVLEPIGSLPVIIEDDVLIGANSGIFEGSVIKKGAVIAAGVNITKGMKIFDLVNEKIITSDENLEIPPNAVVIMGSRAICGNEFAKSHNLAISTPLIVKYRDQNTNAKTSLEMSLRAK